MLINNYDITFINQNSQLFMIPMNITLVITIDDRHYRLLFFKEDSGYKSFPLYTSHHYLIADLFEKGLIPNELVHYLVEQNFVEQIMISDSDRKVLDEHKNYFILKLTTKSLIQALKNT